VNGLRSTLVLAAHAFVVWALCGATMGIGLATTTLPVALAVHAIAAPIVAAAVAFAYFTRFGGTGPLRTAAFVVGFVMVVDFFLVALVINRSLDMFRSFLGTWLPFALLFSATYATGVLARPR